MLRSRRILCRFSSNTAPPKPSSARISCVCWPSAGTSPMRGGACCRLCGGSSAGIGPGRRIHIHPPAAGRQLRMARHFGRRRSPRRWRSRPGRAAPATSARVFAAKRSSINASNSARFRKRAALRREAFVVGQLRAFRAPARRSAATRARSESRSSPRHRRTRYAPYGTIILCRNRRALRNLPVPMPDVERRHHPFREAFQHRDVDALAARRSLARFSSAARIDE